MTAQEARDLSNSVRAQIDAEKKAKIDFLVNEILIHVDAEARVGGTQIVFGNKLNSYSPSELDAVRYQLKQLGYNFSNQTENGLNYEIMYW